MLFDAYLNFVLGVLTYLVSLLPLADLDSVAEVTQQFQTLQDFTASVTYFFPVGAVWDVLSVIFSVETALLVYKFTRHLASAVTAGFAKV